MQSGAAEDKIVSTLECCVLAMTKARFNAIPARAVFHAERPAQATLEGQYPGVCHGIDEETCACSDICLEQYAIRDVEGVRINQKYFGDRRTMSQVVSFHANITYWETHRCILGHLYRHCACFHFARNGPK